MSEVPDKIIIKGKEIEIEITKHPQLAAAYDPIQNVIFMNHKLLDHPELFEYVFKHEKDHAKYPKGIFIHTWIDIRDWTKRPWKVRTELNKIFSLKKYWRGIIANLLLIGFFALIIIVPIKIFIEICEMLF